MANVPSVAMEHEYCRTCAGKLRERTLQSSVGLSIDKVLEMFSGQPRGESIKVHSYFTICFGYILFADQWFTIRVVTWQISPLE